LEEALDLSFDRILMMMMKMMMICNTKKTQNRRFWLGNGAQCNDLKNEKKFKENIEIG
jgi:hypothetical protein